MQAVASYNLNREVIPYDCEAPIYKLLYKLPVPQWWHNLKMQHRCQMSQNTVVRLLYICFPPDEGDRKHGKFLIAEKRSPAFRSPARWRRGKIKALTPFANYQGVSAKKI